MAYSALLSKEYSTCLKCPLCIVSSPNDIHKCIILNRSVEGIIKSLQCPLPLISLPDENEDLNRFLESIIGDRHE